jgi:hypothetical protein
MSLRRIQLNEFGRNLYFDAGVDISAATSITVKIIKPFGDVVELPATLGTDDYTGKDINCQEKVLEANTYAFISIPQGLINEPGTYLYQLIAPLPTESIPGVEGSFVVGCC